MEDNKTIEEIFEDVKDSKKLNFLIEKLGRKVKINGSILNYPSVYFKRYLECKEKYNIENIRFDKLKKQAELGDFNSISEMSISGSNHKRKLELNLQFWISSGFKNEIEKIIFQSEQI